jgi:hypothetical protein
MDERGLDMEGQRKGAILIDVTQSGDVSFDRSLLSRFGHPVMVCHGPEAAECPLLTQGHCELVDQAHGIMFELDLDRPEHRTILKRYQEVLDEDVPIRAVIKPGQEEKYAELLGRVQVWAKPPDAAQLDAFAAGVDAHDRAVE